MEVAIERPAPYGPLSEQRLRALEERIGTSLPADYREFLLRYNGGVPRPRGFWIVSGREADTVWRLYGLHDGPTWSSIDDYIDLPDWYSIPKGLLAIGDDGVGNHICLRVDEEDAGAVYFWDHELRAPGMGDSYQGITRIANSFTDFLDMLEDLG